MARITGYHGTLSIGGKQIPLVCDWKVIPPAPCILSDFDAWFRWCVVHVVEREHPGIPKSLEKRFEPLEDAR